MIQSKCSVSLPPSNTSLPQAVNNDRFLSFFSVPQESKERRVCRFPLFSAIEREEADEKARIEKEEKEREYRERVAKLDEMERKRREREKEIEEKNQRGSRPDSERDGPSKGLERDRDRDRYGPPRREEKGSSYFL